MPSANKRILRQIFGPADIGHHFETESIDASLVLAVERFERSDLASLRPGYQLAFRHGVCCDDSP